MSLKSVCPPVCLFLISLLDVLLTTVFYLHGGAYYHFAVDFRHFHIETSMLELWLFSVLRASVLIGCSVGVICRHDAISRTRIHKSRMVIFLIALFMWMYTVIKLLMFSEQQPPAWNQPWFWLLFTWSLVAIAMFYTGWMLMAKFACCEAGRVLLVNASSSSDEERQTLLAGGAEEEGEKEELSLRKKSSNVLRLLVCAKPDLFLLIPASFFLVASSTAQIFTPYYTGQVIQSIAIEKNQHKFIMAIIYMSSFSVVSAVCAGLRGCLFKISMARLNIRIRNQLFLSIVQQEVGFFDTIKTGDITSRLTADTQSISESLSLSCNIFLRSLIKAIGVCVFMFKLSWRLSLVTIIGIPIIMAVSKMYGGYYQKLSKAVQDSLAEANTVAEETCSSLRTVRSFANELTESACYARKLLITYGLKKKEAYAYAGYVWCNEIFALSLIVASLYYGGHLVVNNFITGGHLISFILYQFELSFALESIGDVYTSLMQAVGASEKVFEFIDRKPLISPTGGEYRPEKMAGKVQFHNVTFAYPSRPDSIVLHNVSFKVDPGEVVALVGPSGGGKSSCVNLLEHFYECLEGDVLIDDVPISSYDHKYLHNKISLVGQEPVLYARSIKNNIAYGLENCDFSQIEQAARMANAHQFITEMKEGYDATTGEKGTQLSGGQKQRVAIARAIVRNPSILLLDEATSALDSESEYLVQQALYNNLKGRTVIIIAHRLSTVEKANRIIVIEKGRVIEQGSHAELLSKGSTGLYYRLVQRQLLGFDVGFTNHVTKAPPETTQSSDSFKAISSDMFIRESPPTRYGSLC